MFYKAVSATNFIYFAIMSSGLARTCNSSTYTIRWQV